MYGRISSISAYCLPDIITDVKYMALLGQYWEFEYHPSIMYHCQHVLDVYYIVGMVIIVE